MDGGGPAPVGWRSTIPGVSQRDGAPVSLGIVPSWGDAAPRSDAVGVDGSGAVRGTVHGGGGRVPWRALGLAVLALAAIVGVARVAGAERGHVTEAEAGWQPSAASSGPSPPAGSGASAGPDPGDVLVGDPPDWSAVLAELDRRRSMALAELDLDSLAEHALPGSPAWDSDAALVADLGERGLHPQGLTSLVLAAEVVVRQGDQARLVIVDQRSGYELVDARGQVIDRVEAAAPMRWSVTLQQRPEADRGWRIVEVIPADGRSGDDVGEVDP